MSDKKIGSRHFRSPDGMLATDSIKLQVRLMKLIGPGAERLPALFGGWQALNGQDDAMMALGPAASVLNDIFSKADPDDVANLIRDVCQLGSISMDGKSYDDIDFDGEFSGSNSRDIIPVVAFMLRETLGDFFSGLLDNGKPGKKPRD